MPVYIILTENSDDWPEDRNKEIKWAGTDGEEGCRIVNETYADTIIYEVWEKDECISSYSRDYIKPDGLGRGSYFSKWDRQCGIVNRRLETQ